MIWKSREDGEAVGRFVGENIQRDIVNNYVDSYINATSDYSRFQDTAPNFVTYYSKDFSQSTTDYGLDAVDEVIGYNSPIKYHKIKNFPLYSVSEMNPNYDFDEDDGIGISGLESEAVILPKTITPQPDDIIIFDYHSRGDTFKMFRVDNVEISILDSQSYYKINYSNFSADIEALDKRQVSETYTTVYANIGTDNNAIILEDKYTDIKKNINGLNDLTELFVANYYNEKVNNFVIQNDNDYFYDPYMIKFINEHKLFINRQTYLKNIRLHSPKNISHSKYMDSVYSKLEKQSDENFPNYIFYNKEIKGMFKLFREKYYSIGYYSIDNTSYANKDLPSLYNMGLFDVIRNQLRDYQNKNSLEGNSPPVKAIILYIKNEEIDKDLIDECVKYYLDIMDLMDIQDFIIFPCIMYILKNKIDSVFK